MKRILFITFALFFVINVSGETLQWPTSKVVFTSQFGESRGDHWHNGVDIISGTDYSLNSPGNAEVIFRRDEGDSPLPDQFGAGNLLVLEHSNQLRTFYYHLEAGSIIKNKTRVTTEDRIASIGNSGKSSGPHLHLSVYSSKNDRILNPIDFFPGFNDKKKPVIKKILLKGPMSDYTNILKHKKVRRKRYFRVIIVVNDVKEGPKWANSPLGTRNIKLFIDDKLVKKIDFNYIALKDNRYCLNGDRDLTFERLYLKVAYYMDLTGFVPKKEKHKFSVWVRDNAGHEKSKTVTVKFY